MLIFLLGLLFFLSIPIILTYFLYKHIKRKSANKVFRCLSFIPLLLFGYLIWAAFYPGEDFYKIDFKEVTELDCPEKADFVYKYASFPDPFGDYTSVFLIQIDPAEYKRLLHHLPNAGFVTTNNDPRHVPQTQIALTKAPSQISMGFINETKEHKSFYVALFNDRKTVLVRRHSW